VARGLQFHFPEGFFVRSIGTICWNAALAVFLVSGVCLANARECAFKALDQDASRRFWEMGEIAFNYSAYPADQRRHALEIREEIIRAAIADFPIGQVISGPGHHDLRSPATVLVIADQLARNGRIDVADPAVLNVKVTELSPDRYEIEAVECQDGNYRLAAYLLEGKRATLGQLPADQIRVKVNGWTREGDFKPHGVPREVVTAAGTHDIPWTDITGKPGTRGPTVEIPDDIFSNDWRIDPAMRGVPIRETLRRSMVRVKHSVDDALGRLSGRPANETHR
jgi:hypothetical protein